MPTFFVAEHARLTLAVVVGLTLAVARTACITMRIRSFCLYWAARRKPLERMQARSAPVNVSMGGGGCPSERVGAVHGSRLQVSDRFIPHQLRNRMEWHDQRGLRGDLSRLGEEIFVRLPHPFPLIGFPMAEHTMIALAERDDVIPRLVRMVFPEPSRAIRDNLRSRAVGQFLNLSL